MTEVLTFSQLWQGLSAGPDEPLFMSSRNAATSASLHEDVLSLCWALKDKNWRYVGLYCDDSYAFCVSFLACALAGITPSVLPQRGQNFLAMITSRLDGLILDAPVALTDLTSLYWKAEYRTEEIDWPDSPGRFSFWTSGSTGKPKEVIKPLFAMEHEAYMLEQVFGGEKAPQIIGGTVSHQHYYGASFRIFWPLLSSRRVWRDILRYPADMLCAGKAAIGIASTPSFLSRSVDLLPLAEMQACGHRLFSSGAPLGDECGMRIAAGGGSLLLREILGSTETGGVAYRCPGEEGWSVFPGVEVTVDDDLLFIESKGTGEENKVALGDRGYLDDGGRLHLQGRRDKVVKIREKRVSLIEIEDAMKGHSFIKDAATLPMEKQGSIELGAVVVPSPCGFEFLRQNGRRAFREELQNVFKERFEPVVWPKKWRFVRQLPRTSMSKITTSRLLDLFERDWGLFAHQSKIFAPHIVHEKTSEASREITFDLDETLGWFEGHFSNFPILPGVVQLKWVRDFSRPLGLEDKNFKGLSRVKFVHPICPPARVTLSVSHNVDRASLAFKYWDDEKVYSSGRFRYG